MVHGIFELQIYLKLKHWIKSITDNFDVKLKMKIYQN